MVKAPRATRNVPDIIEPITSCGAVSGRSATGQLRCRACLGSVDRVDRVAVVDLHADEWRKASEDIGGPCLKPDDQNWHGQGSGVERDALGRPHDAGEDEQTLQVRRHQCV